MQKVKKSIVCWAAASTCGGVLLCAGFYENRPEEGYIKCPEFWDREYAQKYAELWHIMTPKTQLKRQFWKTE